MRLLLNGKPADLDDEATVADLVRDRIGTGSRRGIAVALNGEVVPRNEWDTTTIRDDDRVEVLSAAQGG